MRLALRIDSRVDEARGVMAIFLNERGRGCAALPYSNISLYWTVSRAVIPIENSGINTPNGEQDPSDHESGASPFGR